MATANKPAKNATAQEHSGSSELTRAMKEFQSRFPGVDKKRVNTFTNSMYANLDDIMNASKPLLDELNLFVTFPVSIMEVGGKAVSVMTCVVVHVPTGLKMESSLPLPGIEAGAQPIGSCTTYWRRYLFCGLFNVVETDDDDGNATMPVNNEVARLTEKQHSEILDFVDATGTKMGNTETEGTLLYHIHTTMNLSEVEQLSARQASTVLKMLKTKYKRQQEEKNG